MKLPQILTTIAKELDKVGAKAIIVGGSVRDHFLSLPCKDYDVEVYGLETLDALDGILSQYGTVNHVGKSFGVLKFNFEGEEYDFSFPRTEVKIGSRHQDFEVSVDGSLAFEQAARRRDFTINALGYDVVEKKFLDPFDGLKDIELKYLRAIDNKTFIEDPLRVYRGVQFAARFEYKLAEETILLCKQMVKEGMLDALPKERVYEEFKKLLLKSKQPSIGFELMKALGILEKYFPELHALIGVPQSPKWHPEGDVWIHTMMTLDVMAKELEQLKNLSSKEKLRFLFAMLSHDLGKVTTTTVDEEGKVRAIGHETQGLTYTEKLLSRLTDDQDLLKGILPLVEHHLKPSQFYSSGAKAAAIRRLSTKVNIKELILVAKADFLGRTTKEALQGEYEAGEWLLKKAEKLKVENKAPVHFIQGRDLIALGLSPSPKFKEIIEAIYHHQLDGDFANKDEALTYVKEHYL